MRFSRSAALREILQVPVTGFPPLPRMRFPGTVRPSVPRTTCLLLLLLLVSATSLCPPSAFAPE
ncbi:MAG: hypothetical protein PHX57_13805, partial [Desulfobulbaceae bacterium]|nr:hypothetical protein [Desulfobulbaceae bacterium]